MTRILPPLLAVAAYAQSVGTASRVVTLAPEEIVVDLVLSTPLDTLPEQAAGFLAPLNITAAQLDGAGTLREDNDRLGWQFTFSRPYQSLYELTKQLQHTARELDRQKYALRYQFFFRPAAKTLDTVKRRVLAELLSEAKRSAGGSGKIRSVVFSPAPEHIDALRAPQVFGQAQGALQVQFSVVAVFENE